MQRARAKCLLNVDEQHKNTYTFLESGELKCKLQAISCHFASILECVCLWFRVWVTHFSIVCWKLGLFVRESDACVCFRLCFCCNQTKLLNPFFNCQSRFSINTYLFSNWIIRHFYMINPFLSLSLARSFHRSCSLFLFWFAFEIALILIITHSLWLGCDIQCLLISNNVYKRFATSFAVASS